MRALVEKHGAPPVIEAAAKAIPARQRRAAFAAAADLVLVDGRLDRLEARFLRVIADNLGLDRRTATNILNVVRIKNSV